MTHLNQSRSISRLGLASALLFVSGILISAAGEKTQTKHFELENGMRIFLYERHILPLVNIVVGVDLGSKNETEETSGLVHLLEHYILFRGTEFRTGTEIGHDTRKHGAYFNAHTGQDFSFFELSLPSEYADFGLNNQKDVLFNLKLTQESLEQEKRVILEEISQMRDDPIKYGTSLVYLNLFKDHAYRQPIHGNRGIIESATVEKMEEFYRTYFIPQNCALAVVGDFSIEGMEKKVRDVFGTLEKGEPVASDFEMSPPLEKTIEIEEEMDINLGYLVIGMIGPDYKNDDQFAVDVLSDIWGSGINPMFYAELQQNRIRANSVRMGNVSHKFGGTILLYITVDPKRLKSARREAVRILKEARRRNYSKSDYMGEERFYALDFLESAKNQIRFKAHQGQEMGLVVASGLVRHMLMGADLDKGNYIESIESVTSSDVRKAADQYLSRGDYVIVSLIPKEKD